MMLRVVGFIERALLRLGVAAGFLTLVTMLLVVIDIAGRSLLNMPLTGGNELAVLLVVALIYLGMAAAQQRRQNFTIDLVTRLLPDGVMRVLGALTAAISVVVLGLLTWLTAELAWISTIDGESSYGLVAFPIWPSRILIAAGLGCLTVQFLIDFMRQIGVVPPTAPGADDEKAGV